MAYGAICDIYDMGTMGKGDAGEFEIFVEQKCLHRFVVSLFCLI